MNTDPMEPVSGEGLFVAQANGRGLLFVQSLGAVIKRTLAPKEQWIGKDASN